VRGEGTEEIGAGIEFPLKERRKTDIEEAEIEFPGSDGTSGDGARGEGTEEIGAGIEFPQKGRNGGNGH